MQDLYKALGVKQDATLQEIKRAYHKRALKVHPDKGGTEEQFRLVQEAYETISDAEKRRNYEQDWETYLATNDEEISPSTITDFLSPHGEPFSQDFKKQHQAFAREYHHKSLKQGSVLPWFTPFKSDLYQEEKSAFSIIVSRRKAHNVHDIFSLLHPKPWACKSKPPKKLFEQGLSAGIVIAVFIHFLKGGYYGNVLEQINDFISAEIKKIGNLYLLERPLYEGIFEIMSTTTASRQGLDLLKSIQKITTYANKVDTLQFQQILPLLHLPHFRSLYTHALHSYWEDNKEALISENLKAFNGQDETKHVLNQLVEKLTNSDISRDLKSSLRQLIQFIKLLYQFEKGVHESADEPTAAFYREKAFHILDWVPAFSGKAGPKIMVNIFLLAGIYFQRAGVCERIPAMAMADEKLASQMYLSTIGIGNHTTPDIELYALTQGLKYIAAFRFQNPDLKKFIPALQERALIIADIFPFFDAPQSNVSLFNQGNDATKLMRHYLHALVNIIEYNKNNPQEKVSIGYDDVTVLYQAYEACLKGWYKKEHDEEVEQKLRLDLMEALLLEKHWCFADVEENMDWPWVMIDRDSNGWMKPTRTLAFPEDPAIQKFTSLDGFEINHKTGEITILLNRWDDPGYPHHQAFTMLDLSELIEKNVTGAIFSLDPVDSNKPYHPFNAMRFAPENLYKTELLNTMLLTDYMLKFLTVNREVQGRHPYALRPIDQMIKHLPRYLRKIITAYHGEQQSGALHRFWIEAEEIEVFNDEKGQREDVEKIIFGEPKMVVKKHVMTRDINGNLVDADENEEGWPIYVFNRRRDWHESYAPFQDHAMVYSIRENKFYFIEHGEITQVLSPKNPGEMLVRLYNQPRERDGKVKSSQRNAHLIYRLTKEMTRQAGLSHRYSPEYIFAYEFTRHYDEFGLYLPEFARLKQLSKMLTLIRLMDGTRRGNKESLDALNYLLSNRRQAQPDTEIYKKHKENYDENHQNISKQFWKLSDKLKYGVLLNEWREKLRDIQKNLGTLTFGNHSSEVDDICQRMYNDTKDNAISKYGYTAWSQASDRVWSEVNNQRSGIARELTQAKQKNCREQLHKVFSAILSHKSYAERDQLIDYFIAGNVDPFAKALASSEQSKHIKDIQAQNPGLSASNIEAALNGSANAIARIATHEVNRHLRPQRDAKTKLEANFTELGLGKRKDSVDLKEACLWVPASVRHEIRPALARNSFFVYGGVNLQANVRFSNQGPNNRLGGLPPGGPFGGGPPAGYTGGQVAQLSSPRNFHLNKVEHPKLYRIVDNLYRPTAKYGSGSTADAVRHELRTGELLSRTGHITKAVEARDSLSKLMKSGQLSNQDLHVARWIRKDLHASLNQQPWNNVYPGRQGMRP